jgi:hypothetical protein
MRHFPAKLLESIDKQLNVFSLVPHLRDRQVMYVALIVADHSANGIAPGGGNRGGRINHVRHNMHARVVARKNRAAIFRRRPYFLNMFDGSFISPRKIIRFPYGNGDDIFISEAVSAEDRGIIVRLLVQNHHIRLIEPGNEGVRFADQAAVGLRGAVMARIIRRDIGDAHGRRHGAK